MEAESHDAPVRWSSRAWGWVREIAIGLVLIAVASVAIGYLRAPSLPEVAPDFTLPDVDGGQVTLSELRGQVVVLNFWAEWCGPCRLEIPTFSRFARNHPGVAVLGVATDGTVPRLKRVREHLGIDYPVLLADRATVAAYGVSTLPTTVIVDPEGRVRTAHTGIMFGPHLAWVARP